MMERMFFKRFRKMENKKNQEKGGIENGEKIFFLKEGKEIKWRE